MKVNVVLWLESRICHFECLIYETKCLVFMLFTIFGYHFDTLK